MQRFFFLLQVKILTLLFFGMRTTRRGRRRWNVFRPGSKIPKENNLRCPVKGEMNLRRALQGLAFIRLFANNLLKRLCIKIAISIFRRLVTTTSQKFSISKHHSSACSALSSASNKNCYSWHDTAFNEYNGTWW